MRAPRHLALANLQRTYPTPPPAPRRQRTARPLQRCRSRVVETRGLEPLTPALQRRSAGTWGSDVLAGQRRDQRPRWMLDTRACPNCALRRAAPTRNSAAKSKAASAAVGRPSPSLSQRDVARLVGKWEQAIAKDGRGPAADWLHVSSMPCTAIRRSLQHCVATASRSAAATHGSRWSPCPTRARSRDLLSKEQGSSLPFHLTSRKSRRGTGISRGSRSLGGTSWQMSRPMAASFAGLSKKARRARVSVSGSIRC